LMAHRELPHYAEFRLLTDPWTRSRRVLTFGLAHRMPERRDSTTGFECAAVLQSAGAAAALSCHQPRWKGPHLERRLSSGAVELGRRAGPRPAAEVVVRRRGRGGRRGTCPRAGLGARRGVRRRHRA
jgi:hypothetical protein